MEYIAVERGHFFFIPNAYILTAFRILRYKLITLHRSFEEVNEYFMIAVTF